MKISLNWIKEFTDVNLSKEQLLDRINAQLGAVEEIVDLTEKYQGVIISKIISAYPHPDADRLKICLIDDGGVTADVERNQDGLIQVVCGAPNARDAILVAWLPPGSTVPASFGDKQPLILDVRKLRGEISNGMLASGMELGLSDDHQGIVEIDVEASPGDDFASKYELDDLIIDIENKMFTHRPDCFGILGVARELSGIQGLKFKSPDWYTREITEIKSGVDLPFEIENQIRQLVPRFSAASIAGIEIKKSSLKMQSYLSRLGFKSINNVVDITNFIMLLTAQPIHAYDYDKLMKLDNSGRVKLVARHPQPGEKITLLNSKTIEPNSGDMMVASSSKLVCLGGAIGGTNADVDDSTKNIILEAANWDMYQLRRTSMKHGVFTDAVTRFTKGQSKAQTMPTLMQAVNMILKNTGKLGMIVDQYDELNENQNLDINLDFINQRLGSKLSLEQMTNILSDVEFEVSQVTSNVISVRAPFWRTDIEIKEDIVEEIGRLYSYDKLEQTLPKRSISPSVSEGNLKLNQHLRELLLATGANELLTYNFISKKLMETTNQDVKVAHEIKNALSPELNYYRVSILPNLLEKIHANHKAGFDQFALFELGKVHNLIELEEDLPIERSVASFVFSVDEKAASRYEGAPFFQAKAYLSKILANADQDLDFVSLESAVVTDNPWLENLSKLFIESRSAVVSVGGNKLGIVGEFLPSIKSLLKLPNFCSGFEIDISLLGKASRRTAYRPLSKFQYSEVDVTYVVSNASHAEVKETISKTLKTSGYEFVLTSLDSFKPNGSGAINLTFRIRLASQERTMSSDDVRQVLSQLDQVMSEQVSASRV